MNIKEILQNLQENKISVEEAEREIKNNQYEELGYAKIDHNRKERSGASEVVFCQGKPDEFLTKIYSTIYKENGEVLGTRASKEQYELVKKDIPNVKYDSISRILKIEKEKKLLGNIAICTGGTADIPVAEEAALAVATDKGDDIIYISVMNNLSVDCDCDSNPAEPDTHDIGILASKDPVALDKACVDLAYSAQDGESLIERMESRNGIHTLEYGAQIGLGNLNYELVNIDARNN